MKSGVDQMAIKNFTIHEMVHIYPNKITISNLLRQDGEIDNCCLKKILQFNQILRKIETKMLK